MLGAAAVVGSSAPDTLAPTLLCESNLPPNAKPPSVVPEPEKVILTFESMTELLSVETIPIRAEPETATSAAAKPADMLKIVVARRILPCQN